MRQAITTNYLGPTDHRGARVKAKCEAGSLTVSWDDALDVRDNHAVAARMLCEKLGWDATQFKGGATALGYAFVDTRVPPITEAQQTCW